MLKIMTTGLDQFAPGGGARLKIMLIGGPGAGKTRVSSYWPKPIYGDCEGGLASVADRQVPFVSVKSSQDMLDFLAHLKRENMRPWADRAYQTVVIDTLDAFQRKVKDEWLQANPNAQSFRGFDAWGYLDAKMQMLLTRLLNLDMNVIVNVHYKDKTIKEGTGENASERQELMLQLSGDVKDSVFNDFDLVGWMGTYWEPVDGQRTEKRGLTFRRTPDKPFLKDRLFITPPWLEVTFSDEDYESLFAPFKARMQQMGASADVGEIEPSHEETTPSAGVVAPGAGGALPAQDPREVPLHQYDKPTLQKVARELGIEFKANTLKGELIQMIEAKQAEKAAASAEAPAAEAPAAAETPVQPAPAETPATPVDPPAPAPAVADTGTSDAVSAPASAAQEPTTPTPAATAPEPAAPAAEPAPAAPVPAAEVPAAAPVEAPAEPTHDEAVATAQAALGGEVVAENTVQTEVGPVNPTTGEVNPAPAPAASAPATTAQAPAGQGDSGVCDWADCTKDLASQDPNKKKLGYIKWRFNLCDEHFLAKKSDPDLVNPRTGTAKG